MGRLVLVAALAAVTLAAGAAPAGAKPSITQLRQQRQALITRIAEASDRLASAELRVGAAKQRQASVAAGFELARRRFARWAVNAWVEAGDDPEEVQLRRKSWVEAAAADDHQVLRQVQVRKATADSVAAEAERAAADARRSRKALDDLRAVLEQTITKRVNEEGALRAAEAADVIRPGAGRVTRSQSELMARYPFGPVSSFPEGLVPTGLVVNGIASWYGPGFDGRLTASGAVFDQEGWTVASRTLPLGTMLLITRGDTTVLALVNDRGPYVTGRVLDLSHGVAEALGTVHAGIAQVHAEVVVPLGE